MSHNHNHNHNHSHSHSHDHGSSSGNIAVAFFLNLGFAVLEFFGGIYTNSVAITSDALHDFGDSISLGVAWYFEKLSKRKPSKRFSYGLKRFSILGALFNSLVLLAGSVVVLYAAIPRLFSPEQSDAAGMFWFAIIGIAVNGAAVFRLRRGSSVNERVVSLHLLEDVLGWVAVLIGSGVMYFFNVPIIDPLLSLAITAYILYNVYCNLKTVVMTLLQGVPVDIDLSAVKASILGVNCTCDVHDLHVWSMDGRYNVLSAHVVAAADCDPAAIKTQVRELLHSEFDIVHATIEIELAGEHCSADCCN